ncbi:sigma-70 family RNA polymerase sigma factor [Amorphoplanes nipponensis]|uniref:RNA polymerase sigma factor n=1 Tax=Actinoplanes nipponensis TaxID=135950 RepID=A0A919MR56_9ACTN|nr:sigma-70 family RNA polymerase sigma factor [Actinoplanes nipponensis]GIE46580.1 RNA polymerase sigma factor [Actinoplanes nipponensis]
MSETDQLARRFEADRPHLRAVAHRMLGSAAEAEDAVQEAWLRLSRSDTSAVANLTGWLTTVVSRVCLDMLRARAARREDGAGLPETPAGEQTHPESEALLADAIGPALLVVLDTLTPGERLAFVLHDLFAVPFPEIAEIAGCSPAAARQLASRARRKVQGREAEEDRVRSRTVVEAFLAASRGGDFAALLALLDPEVVLRADAAAVRFGASELLRGADAVAGTFSGRARHARPALLDGEPGLVWAPGGTPRVAFAFTVAGGRITGIEQIAEPAELGAMAVILLGD